jgi:hypothetical protein
MFKATLKRRATTLSKTLLTAGLLGGAALSTLGAGSAQAATGCGIQISWLAWIGGQNLTCGDKEFKWLSTAVPGDLPSSMVSAVQPLLEDYIFNLDKPFTSDPFDFTYEATITDPGYVFIAVDLDSDSDALASPPSVLEATYTFAGGNSPIMLTSTNGSSSVAPVTGGPTTITVNNRYDGSGGAIDTMENSFQQVPAPLPLLGVGAAFGSIRKLRKFSSQLKTFSMG